VDDLKILITGCGAPGAYTIIKKFREITERKIELIGIDMNPCATGKHFVDDFYTVPPANSDEYISTIEHLVEHLKPDILLPFTSPELIPLSKIFTYTEIMVNDTSTLITADNKYKLYEALKGKIPLPEYRLIKGPKEFWFKKGELGYPDKKLCIKPVIGMGSRGFRIFDSNINKRDIFLNHKSDSAYMDICQFTSIFTKDDHKYVFPPMLLSEFIEDTEYDCMVLANGKESLLTTVKTRDSARCGFSFSGELIESEEHMELCNIIVKILSLKYCNGIQFIGNKLIEVNPRVSTFVFGEGDSFNEVYLSIKMALGELTEDEIREYKYKLPMKTKWIRIMDQYFYE